MPHWHIYALVARMRYNLLGTRMQNSGARTSSRSLKRAKSNIVPQEHLNIRFRLNKGKISYYLKLVPNFSLCQA